MTALTIRADSAVARALEFLLVERVGGTRSDIVRGHLPPAPDMEGTAVTVLVERTTAVDPGRLGDFAAGSARTSSPRWTRRSGSPRDWTEVPA